jgi:hypothetical protein
MYPQNSESKNDYESVAATTLDTIFERHRVSRCDLMKIDVEGAEYEILFGASKNTLAAIKSLYGEFHEIQSEEPDFNIDSLAVYLNQHGFDIRVVRNPRNPKIGMFFATS